MFYRTILGVLLIIFLTTPSVIIAGEVEQIDPISFGAILLHPMGDTVVINAGSGSAVPLAIKSEVLGGGSGKITLSSTELEHADLVYPTSVVLVDGAKEIVIEDIRPYSQYSATGVDIDANKAVEINVGGKIKLGPDAMEGSYKGTMVILINFS